MRLLDFGGGPDLTRKARTGSCAAENRLFALPSQPKQEDPTFFIGRRGCLFLLLSIGGRAEGAGGGFIKFEVNCEFDFVIAAVLKSLLQLHCKHLNWRSGSETFQEPQGETDTLCIQKKVASICQDLP